MVKAACSIAGLRMDPGVSGERFSCDIELIGYPGDFEDALLQERYKMFHRAGLSLLPLPYSRWTFERQCCLDAVLTAGSMRKL